MLWKTLIALLVVALAYPAYAVLNEDADGDGYNDLSDNCPGVYNPGQEDSDQQFPSQNVPPDLYDPNGIPDGVGDACDNCKFWYNPVFNSSVYPYGLTLDPWVTLTGGQRDDDADGYGNQCDSKFVGTPNQSVGGLDLSQLNASDDEDARYDTCGTTNTRPCAIFELELDQGSYDYTIQSPGLDKTRHQALANVPQGPRCPTCPLRCASGTAGDCLSVNSGKWGPLGFYDMTFWHVTENPDGQDTLSPSSALADQSYTGYGGAPSSLVCQGDCTLQRLRADVRNDVITHETGTLTVRDSYLECHGEGGDHADGIASEGLEDGNLVLERVTFSAADPDGAGTTHKPCRATEYGNVELFNVTLNGVVGIDAYMKIDLAEGIESTWNVNNVCFTTAADEEYPMRWSVPEGTTVTVESWSNVRTDCEIVNGVPTGGTLQDCSFEDAFDDEGGTLDCSAVE